jgi:hypothetical protein
MVIPIAVIIVAAAVLIVFIVLPVTFQHLSCLTPSMWCKVRDRRTVTHLI